MAEVTTEIAWPPTTFPVIGIAGYPRPNYIPRAEIVFGIQQNAYGAIAVATGGDTQKLSMTFPLASGFAYVLRHIDCMLWGADITEWNDAMYTCFRDDTNGPHLYDVAVEAGSVNNLPGKYYVPRPGAIPERTIIALNGGELCMDISNSTADGSAMTVRLKVVLLQYDLDQAYSWAINAPILTR